MAKKIQQKYLVHNDETEFEETPQDLLKTGRQKYLLVNVIARRARELNRGELARVELPEPRTYIELAEAETKGAKLELIKKQGQKRLVSLIDQE